MPSTSQPFPNKEHQKVPQTISSSSPYTIYVSPLPADITREDLIQLFTLCGYVLEVRIIKKPPFVYSYAHVDFADSVSREKAKKFYHGKKLGDKFLLVEDKISRSRIYPKAAIKTDNSDKQTVYGDDLKKQEPNPRKKIHLNPSYIPNKDERPSLKHYESSSSYRHKDSYSNFYPKHKDYYQRGQKNYQKGLQKYSYRKCKYNCDRQPERKEDSFEY